MKSNYSESKTLAPMRRGATARIGLLLASSIALPLQQAWAASPAVTDSDDHGPVVEVKAALPGALQRGLATGSRLGLSAMETPASVESISRTQLVDRGDTRVIDAISKAAGLNVFPHPGNGGAAVAARGFTDLASVTQLYDGVKPYGAGALTFPFDTWSVDSIEVLRGPASVIYGEGAIGGVINVIPKKPGQTPVRNEIQLGLGSENTRRFAFGSGGAVAPHWSYRLDASANRSDNWVDRGQSSDTTVSGALRYDVSPALHVTLSHAQGNQRPMRYFGVPLINGQFSPATFNKNYNVADSLIQYRDSLTSLAMEWQAAPGLEVSSSIYRIKSRRHWRDAETYQWQAASGLVGRSGYTEILHGLEQVGSTTSFKRDSQLFGLANTFSGGVEVNRTTFQHTNNAPYSGSSTVDLDNSQPGLFLTADATLPKYRVNAHQYALFIEDHVKLNGQWSLIGGLRYDHDDVSRRDVIHPAASFDKTFSNLGYRLGTVFDISAHSALYGQYSVASDPLGPLLFTNASRAAFDLARGKQIEVGFKQAFWDKQGDWTVSAYRIVKNHLLTRDPGNINQSIQVGQQSSRGLEATFSVAPNADWKLEGNAALVRARYDDFAEASAGQLLSRDGNTPTDVPKRTANLFAHYRLASNWTAIASLHHVGQRNADIANTLKMPSYSTTDLALRWQLAAATSLTLRGYNVFNQRYAETAYYNQTQWLLGADRRAELQLNHRF
ncbi:TonB-dependent receptor [Janthinobacterium agaricidamnosum]|uniref:TonB-dependent siderophore receptor family protein n=1 Tax=Janthinobacterium agaricidamnosum NBRC 102515 = DSM 9628 TaxID=1349767 RepID=W0V722_9BURK|nr:TonB-dependent receptor [Janthinobacterium agaricidamnosum]CDG83148.1 tonB-dependent siderophore receptor family protein [Janthinobacterium agaricidamnosum NBRC 102515 = DSM 9628]